MGGKTATQASAVREGILQYLERHPDASDTLDGIAGWWLTAIDTRPSEDLLQRTLDGLIDEGKIARIVMVDGTHMYARKN